MGKQHVHYIVNIIVVPFEISGTHPKNYCRIYTLTFRLFFRISISSSLCFEHSIKDIFVVIVTTPTIKSLQEIRIIGGEDIEISDAPYQVSLVRRGRHACGGTIVARDIIVTAAHCVSG